MLVCAYGEVSEYCEKHDMVIMKRFTGNLLNYSGEYPVVVTDRLNYQEYLYYKGKMSERGVELVSVHHSDVGEFYATPVKKRRAPGRDKFGFKDGVLTDEGRVVVARIFELLDKGCSVETIRLDEKVHHPDGERIGRSTLYNIVDNREKYEKDGL